MEKGYIHIYTGNGKGKTTAAFGVAIRAAMAGKKIYIGQFVKSMAYSETQITSYLPSIEIEQLGDGCFVQEPPNEQDRNKAKNALERCREKIMSENYDLIILDEINIALYFNLFEETALLEILKQKPPFVEMILTGRYASQTLIDFADLVTEMKEIKHYYQNGVLSRKGIDC